jgi:MGT family glycosyltransferase
MQAGAFAIQSATVPVDIVAQRPTLGSLHVSKHAVFMMICIRAATLFVVIIMQSPVRALHIGLLCPGHSGHLNPTATLGNALQERGHRVTLISTPQPAALAAAERHSLSFEPIGIPEYESGALQTDLTHEGRLRGLQAFRHTIRLFKREEQLILRDLPSLLQRNEIDAICVDQLLPAAVDVCEVYGIPACILCNALPLHLDASIPPFITTWKPPRAQDGGRFGNALRRFPNRVANLGIVMVAAPLYLTINTYRRRNGLKKHGLSTAQNVGNLQLAQIPSFLDFERTSLPSHFYYSQPWHVTQRDANIDFPWEKLDGRPILYVSLGTVQNRLQHLYSVLLNACPESHQLVMALGRKNASLPSEHELPKNAIVVDYAPQTRLLPLADCVVTHAGMNTALEAIRSAKPMVCIPLCNDQPGVAARLEYHGACRLIKSGRATPSTVKKAILLVLEDPSYRRNSEKLSWRIQNECITLEQTAELVEEGLSRPINSPFELGDRVARRPFAASMVATNTSSTIGSRAAP